MILLALRFPDGFSTYPQVFHPKWKRRPAHQHITLHWSVFRYTNLLWRIFTKNLSPLEIHGLSHYVRDQTEKGSNEVNKFLLCGFVSKEGQEKKTLFKTHSRRKWASGITYWLFSFQILFSGLCHFEKSFWIRIGSQLSVCGAIDALDLLWFQGQPILQATSLFKVDLSFIKRN